jgi:hypothetical protein
MDSNGKFSEISVNCLHNGPHVPRMTAIMRLHALTILSKGRSGCCERTPILDLNVQSAICQKLEEDNERMLCVICMLIFRLNLSLITIYRELMPLSLFMENFCLYDLENEILKNIVSSF